jgi:hypothetical protein
MQLIKKYGLYIFSCLLFFDSFLVILNLSKFRLYTIAILIPLLIIYFYKNAKRSKKSVTYKRVYISLAFAFLSDALFLINNYALEKPSEIIVILIFTTLLLANINYALIFLRIKSFNLKKCPEAFIVSLVTIPASIILYKVLNVVTLGSYKYPILIGIVVMVMVLAITANVFGEKAKKSIAFENFIPGMFSLALSLCLMLVFKFLIPDVDFLPSVITLTYGFGHLLIVQGFVKYLKA